MKEAGESGKAQIVVETKAENPPVSNVRAVSFKRVQLLMGLSRRSLMNY